MIYQLDLWQNLEANFFGANILITLIIIVGKLIVPILIYFLLKEHRARNMLIVTYIVVMLICAVVPIWNNGWQIVENKLHLKAYGASVDIDIKSMNIDLVRVSGEWRPGEVYSSNGIRLDNLMVGKVSANGEQVLMFNHYNQEKLLLIESNGDYFLIGNPEIEDLYMELVRLGASKKIIQLHVLRKFTQNSTNIKTN